MACDAQAICQSDATAAEAMQQYRSFLDSCRASGKFLGYDCTGETGDKLASDVQSAVVKANVDENEFLRAWGAAWFVRIKCE